MTLIISLVGGQPLPNLLPVRHYQPDGVLLVYTQRTRSVSDRLKAVLQRETQVYELETDAYDIAAIVKKLNQELETSKLSSHSFLFNLTGGTKPMSLAAFQVAQHRSAPMLYVESERKGILMYRYTWEKQQLQSSSPEVLSECMQLRDFFDVQLGVGVWHENGPSSDEGGHFEIALAEALRMHGYEVMAGIKAMKDQVDIDIALRFENQFGILEAKSGSGGTGLKGIQQLSTNVQFLSIYTQKFYVITVKPSPSQEIIRDAARIQIISLPGYVSKTDETLPSDEAKNFIKAIDQAFKG